MTPTQITYLVFGIVLVLSVIFDLGLFSKKGKSVSIRQALYQTIFWVTLSLLFGGFMWYEEGSTFAFEYVSAYLMEWALSIDNIFVFILIFSYFNIPERHTNRVLLLGILMAIVLRILFITIGIALISKFEWILYIFGAFLIYTGITMFKAKEQDESEDFDPNKNIVYRFVRKVLPLTPDSSSGKFRVSIDGKKYFTMLFVVLIMLATTDIIFALDSIPAVFAISQHPVVIYTSNIFAVLGLRSLFFLLKGAVNKFQYLQHGIAIVLVFIGLKMLIAFFDFHLPVWASLLVIVACLAGSILFSMFQNRKVERS